MWSMRTGRIKKAGETGETEFDLVKYSASATFIISIYPNAYYDAKKKILEW